MKKITRSCILLMLVIASLHLPGRHVHAQLIWPINRPAQITGTFCEPRGIRFHLGIDVSCGGARGFDVYATDEGYISAVMYQKWGIGYAVLVSHPDGRTSLYGHLDRFSGDILSHSKVAAEGRNILDRKDFRVEFSRHELAVKKGCVIGYSGDSGIGKEHFHFEVRDRDNSNLNPLRNGITVPDKSPPVFTLLHALPLDGKSLVNDLPCEGTIDLVPSDGSGALYGLKRGTSLTASGTVGFKVQLYDRVNYRRKVGIYRLELYVDKKKSYEAVFDAMPRESNHSMGLFYDYDHTNNSVYTYYLYSRISRDGYVQIPAAGKEKAVRALDIEVRTCDANLNCSTARLSLTPSSQTADEYPAPENNLVPGKNLDVYSDDKSFHLAFSKKAAYYPESVTVFGYPPLRTGVKGFVTKSRVYAVEPTNLCLKEAAIVSLAYTGDDVRKTGIFSLDQKKNIYYFLGADYNAKKGLYQAGVQKMGGFFLMRDDVPPRIRSVKTGRVKAGHRFRFYVADAGMGTDLNRVTIKVDGRDVIWDYDPDYGFIEILPHNEIWSRGAHTILVQVQDLAGNLSNKVMVNYMIQP